MEGDRTEVTFWLDNYKRYHTNSIISHFPKKFIKSEFNFITSQEDLVAELCGKICVTSVNFNLTFNDGIVVSVNDYIFDKISESYYRRLEIDPKVHTLFSVQFVIYIVLFTFSLLIYLACKYCDRLRKNYTILEKDVNDSCSICLESFIFGEKVRKTVCKHIFHLECIDEWTSINNVCPLCKSDMNAV